MRQGKNVTPALRNWYRNGAHPHQSRAKHGALAEGTVSGSGRWGGDGGGAAGGVKGLPYLNECLSGPETLRFRTVFMHINFLQ